MTARAEGLPNPFLALKPFGPEDASRFFGREADLVLVQGRLFSARATLLFAGSGVGKTSFLQARLIPSLESEWLVVSARDWAGRAPLDVLDQAIGTPPAGLDLSQADARRQWLESLAASRVRRQCLVVLDQFEEVFQHWRESRPLDEFAEQLAALTQHAAMDIRVLIAMREEFLGELSLFDNLIPDLFNNSYRLKNPTRSQARDIIVSTARSQSPVECGAGLEPLLDELLQMRSGAPHGGPTVVRSRIAMPFLQIVCHRLWDREMGGTVLEPHAPDGTPTVDVFLKAYEQDTARRQLKGYVFEKLTVDRQQQDLLSAAFGLLITRHGAKMAYPVDTLADQMNAPADNLLTALRSLSTPEVRILREIADRPGLAPWFELYHDMYAPFLLEWKKAHDEAREREREREREQEREREMQRGVGREVRRRLTSVALRSMVVIVPVLLVFGFGLFNWWSSYQKLRAADPFALPGSPAEQRANDGLVARESLRSVPILNSLARNAAVKYWRQRATWQGMLGQRDAAILGMVRAADEEGRDNGELAAWSGGAYGQLGATYVYDGFLQWASFGSSKSGGPTDTVRAVLSPCLIQSWNRDAHTFTGAVQVPPLSVPGNASSAAGQPPAVTAPSSAPPSTAGAARVPATAARDAAPQDCVSVLDISADGHWALARTLGRIGVVDLTKTEPLPTAEAAPAASSSSKATKAPWIWSEEVDPSTFGRIAEDGTAAYWMTQYGSEGSSSAAFSIVPTTKTTIRAIDGTAKVQFPQRGIGTGRFSRDGHEFYMLSDGGAMIVRRGPDWAAAGSLSLSLESPQPGLSFLAPQQATDLWPVDRARFFVVTTTELQMFEGQQRVGSMPVPFLSTPLRLTFPALGMSPVFAGANAFLPTAPCSTRVPFVAGATTSPEILDLCAWNSVAAASDAGSVLIADVAALREVTPLPITGTFATQTHGSWAQATNWTLSEDGRWLTESDGRATRLRDLRTSDRSTLISGALDLSPDGRYALVSRESSRTVVETEKLLADPGSSGSSIPNTAAWVSDVPSTAVFSEQNGCFIASAENLGRRRRISNDSTCPSPVVVSRDAEFVVLAGDAASAGNALELQRVSDGTRSGLMASEGGMKAHFSPDGQRVLAIVTGSQLKVWDTRNPGKAPATPTSVSEAYEEARFGPGPDLVTAVTTRGDLIVWNPDGSVPPRRIAATLPPPPGGLTFPPAPGAVAYLGRTNDGALAFVIGNNVFWLSQDSTGFVVVRGRPIDYFSAKFGLDPEGVTMVAATGQETAISRFMRHDFSDMKPATAPNNNWRALLDEWQRKLGTQPATAASVAGSPATPVAVPPPPSR